MREMTGEQIKAIHILNALYFLPHKPNQKRNSVVYDCVSRSTGILVNKNKFNVYSKVFVLNTSQSHYISSNNFANSVFEYVFDEYLLTHH